jgi:hypothetical protein
VRVWNKRGFGLFLCAYALSLLAMQACSNDDDEAEARPHADGGESDTNVEDVTVAADAAGADAPHDAKSGECSVKQQNCPAGKKCQAGLTGNDAPRCVEATGTGELGEGCVAANATLGTDTCKAGLACTYYGSGSTAVDDHCRQYCESSGDCAAGESCLRLTNIAVQPPVGVCLARCTLFGSDCNAKTACKIANTTEIPGTESFCMPIGKGGPDASCGTAKDCVPDYTCVRGDAGPHCHAMCDDSHPCNLVDAGGAGDAAQCVVQANGPAEDPSFGACL